MQFRIPKSFEYALGSQSLSADDLSAIFFQIRRIVLPALTCPPSSTSEDSVAVADRVDSNAFMQVDLPGSDQGPRQTC